MGRTRGLILFTLTFPPTHSVRMVFATGGVRVVLGDDVDGMKGLLEFLSNPPESLFSLLKRVATPMVGGNEYEELGEEDWPSMGWDGVEGIFCEKDLGRGVKVDFPPAVSQLVSGLERMWSDLLREKRSRPFSFYLSVERGGREVVVTTTALFRGGDMTTVVGPGASKRDVEVHRALMAFFFLALGRLMKKVVALLRTLRALGAIIFF